MKSYQVRISPQIGDFNFQNSWELEKQTYTKEIEYFRKCEQIQMDYVRSLLENILVSLSSFENNLEGK